MKIKATWIILVICLILCCLYGVANAGTIDSGTCGSNLTWILDDAGTLTINGTGKFTEYSMYDEVPWYSQNQSVKKIIINDGVTNLGSWVFFECSNLVNVSIPDTVTEIGRYAFNGCNSLPNIAIPDTVTRINMCAFSQCTEFTEVKIPNSVSYIGTGAFSGCTNLSSIIIPDNVSFIGEGAFSTSGITCITLPSGIKSIEQNTFLGCSNLSSLIIPNGVESIGECAFADCGNLSSITIPESVTRIGQGAFRECEKLEKVHISNLESWLGIEYLDPYVSDSYPNSHIGCQLYIGDTAITRLVIPEGVTTIPDYAFMCFNFTSVVFPQSLTNIGTYAFNNCLNLTSVTIPSKIECIGFGAFSANTDHPLTIAFAVTDEEKEIDFISPWVLSMSNANIYCHKYTSPHRWCENTPIAPVPIFFEDVDISDILSITMDESISISCGETKPINYDVFPLLDEIEWSSSNPTIVSVSEGKITAHATGSAIVTATIGAVSASMNVECILPVIDFDLSASELWVSAIDESTKLTIRNVIPEDTTDSFSWSSSDTGIATVDNNGLVILKRPRDVIISVTSDSGISKSCLLHICYNVTSINLVSPVDSVQIGSEVQLTAQVSMITQYCENHLVTFSSSDEAVATVDSETGVVHGVSPGTVVITAASTNSNKSDSITIRVEKYDLEGLDILYLPSDLKEIMEEAFAGSACEAVIIPEGCEKIGKKAFDRCGLLLYVYIPSTVTSIEPDAFDNCGNIVFEYGKKD